MLLTLRMSLMNQMQKGDTDELEEAGTLEESPEKPAEKNATTEESNEADSESAGTNTSGDAEKSTEMTPNRQQRLRKPLLTLGRIQPPQRERRQRKTQRQKQQQRPKRKV